MSASVVSEARTVRILIVPIWAFALTHLMSYLNDHDPAMQPLLEQMSIQQDHKSFDPMKSGGRDSFAISTLLNYRDKEPWAQWCARWGLWHLAFFTITTFKMSVVSSKKSSQALAVAYGFAMCGTQWSGFRQWSSKEMNAQYEGTQLQMHGCCAVFLFLCNMIETIWVWWPSKKAAFIMLACYGHVFGFIYLLAKSDYVVNLYVRRTGIPGDALITGTDIRVVVNTLGLEAFEYMNFALHLFIVWYRAPVVLGASKEVSKKKKSN